MPYNTAFLILQVMLPNYYFHLSNIQLVYHLISLLELFWFVVCIHLLEGGRCVVGGEDERKAREEDRSEVQMRWDETRGQIQN